MTKPHTDAPKPIDSFSLSPIGYVESPYTQKFGIARQPGLVAAATVRIRLLPQYGADCVRGLAEFDHIWLQFVFHDALAEGWSPLVRPPRLGGKQKKGVFATRSPHRPNHLGLSLLPLLAIEANDGISLLCGGADLLDGTPVLDIKPYIPFVEAKPEARSGFVAGPPPLLAVVWLPESQGQCTQLALEPQLIQLIEQSIAQDPRPAYQDDPQRVYVMVLAGFQVRFQIVQQQAVVLSVQVV